MTLELWIDSPLAKALSLALAHFIWEGAAIAALVALAFTVFRKSNQRYAIACIALFAMPVAFGITLALSMPRSPVKSLIAIPLPAVSLVAPASAVAVPSWNFAALLAWAAPLWMAGVLALLLYRVAAWMAARRLARLGTCPAPEAWSRRVEALAARIGISRPVQLLESALAEVPVTIGYLRPAILVPIGMLAAWPFDQVEAILLHELAHIRRADYLVNLLQSVVESLLFYHPAVWWISSAIRAEREHCCDDLVLARNIDPRLYAEALFALEQGRAVEPALAANGGNLARRVRRILRSEPARASSLAIAPIVLAILAAGTALAWQQAAPGHPAPTPYDKWISEDVVYIVTAGERAQWNKLTSDADHEKFIDAFWLRRDPTPGTPENEFREEHYRRIAYSNEHFPGSNALPGWKTDRGRIYIIYGPPDEIESHPASNGAPPFDKWRYRYIDGVGSNVIMEFVDATGTGDYRLTTDPNPQQGARVRRR
ncbi:MAG TPA: GWxTD domain-containing protein [Bryobacteraceae bacterium]|nr:GWxTD domain-containing protein [Bryobacteraceae bacterium]